jgi:CDP-diacylglycerol--glycerol-3-phosphate 3-phosphatidyltransferase
MAVAPQSVEPRLSPEAIPAPLDRRSLNAPNIITLSRFVLAIILFGLIDVGGWWITATLIFVVAAATDFIDGWLARRYGQITVLGRVLDPFVDKIIICGSFIFLQKWGESGVTAWMTFIIVAREMFITSLRTFLEQRGKDFSAKWSGKIKMILQCAAVPCCLLSLSPEFREWLTVAFPGGPENYHLLFVGFRTVLGYDRRYGVQRRRVHVAGVPHAHADARLMRPAPIRLPLPCALEYRHEQMLVGGGRRCVGEWMSRIPAVGAGDRGGAQLRELSEGSPAE